MTEHLNFILIVFPNRRKNIICIKLRYSVIADRQKRKRELTTEREIERHHIL